MVLSAVSPTNQRRTISPATEGQPRRDGQSGRLFSLQPREVANDENGDLSVQPTTISANTRPVSEASLEKWLRLMGAARQMAYEGELQTSMPVAADNMRYRLQRTYFDQERQSSPQIPSKTDQRLQAYRIGGGVDDSARFVDFVV